MADLSKADLDHLKKLASLEVSEDRLEVIRPQLLEILEFVGQLQKVDTSKTKGTVEVTGLSNVFSKKEMDSLPANEVVSQADSKNENYVMVKAIFEDNGNA